ncbi:hypothetical protein PR048_032625 [Dryococelus australis]|uniref:Uncharacterized protein n=1 Tax=Dryococelus australis TaxID=614101 RepID=A0ABQ9G2R1_9NEOP|nr:hypothetical protein PR048_032625 [Dryococelus australis]
MGLTRHRNAKAGGTGEPRENPRTSDIIRHDSHCTCETLRRRLCCWLHASLVWRIVCKLRSVTENQLLLQIGFLSDTLQRHVQAVRLLATHQGKPGSILSRVTPGFSQVGIVSDYAVGRRVFSEISRFPHTGIPALLYSHLISPSSALKTSLPLSEEQTVAISKCRLLWGLWWNVLTERFRKWPGVI